MKLKRVIAFLLSTVLMVPAFVQAADEELATISDGVITISGKTDEISGTKVTYVILKPGYKEADLATEEGANAAIEELYQSTVAADGKFTYTYTLETTAKSGEYSVSVKINGEAKKRTDSVIFNNVANLKTAVSLINGGTSTAEVLGLYKDDIDYITGVKYTNATSGQKSYIESAIKPTVTEETLVSQFKEFTDIALKLLSNSSITTQDIKDAVENKYKKLGISDAEYKEYDDLTLAKQEVAIGYMKDYYSSTDTDEMSDFISLYNSGVAYAENSGNPPSNPDIGGDRGGNNNVGGIIAPPSKNDNYLFDPSEIEKFDDLGEATWAKTAIDKLSDLGIVNGKAERIFAPNDNVTREEFVTLIVRAFQFTETNREDKFTDVDKNAWYYNSVRIAYNCNVINGMSDGTFGIGTPITRQDMAVMLQRAADYAGMEMYPIHLDKTLTDMDSVASYALEPVETMVKAGKINGYDDGSFKPSSNATRAEAVQMIYNILFD